MEDEFEAQRAAYRQEQADLAEMHATYEAMDQAEYEEFMAELDSRDAGRH
ncbi:hypothetical protein ACWCQP_45080 [Streptomyces chartreusis]